jgi:hypothetical protein
MPLLPQIPLLPPKPSRGRMPLRSGLALLALVIISALAAPESAQAKSRKNHQNTTSGDAHKKGASKTTYRPSSSEETRAERERRLSRECKGMPNAGACKGYTR